MAVAAAIPIALAVVSAATSAVGAIQQNNAIKKSIASAKKAQQVQQRQIEDQASIETTKARNQTEQVLGRLRISSAEAGVGFSGSYDALQRQSFYDSAINQNIIDRNAYNSTLRSQSEFQATATRLASSYQNIFLSTINGAISGAKTGLSISNGIGNLGGGGGSEDIQPLANIGGSGDNALPSLATDNGVIGFGGTRIT